MGKTGGNIAEKQMLLLYPAPKPKAENLGSYGVRNELLLLSLAADLALSSLLCFSL